jgi:hypothetical protein
MVGNIWRCQDRGGWGGVRQLSNAMIMY